MARTPAAAAASRNASARAATVGKTSGVVTSAMRRWPMDASAATTSRVPAAPSAITLGSPVREARSLSATAGMPRRRSALHEAGDGSPESSTPSTRFSRTSFGTSPDSRETNSCSTCQPCAPTAETTVESRKVCHARSDIRASGVAVTSPTVRFKPRRIGRGR